jgi:YVTN family beta-propeller protein
MRESRVLGHGVRRALLAALLAGVAMTALVGSSGAAPITPTTAYVTNAGLSNHSVTPIDVATNTPGTAITVGSQPVGIAITPDGETAYVSISDTSSVTPIDLATNAPGSAIPVGNSPYGVAITPDGKTAYVTNDGGNSVTPIDVTTNTPGTQIPVGSNPRGIAITPDGTTVYVTNIISDSVTPIDVATNTPGTDIPVTTNPNGVAITPDGKTAYVTHINSDVVTPIDLGTNMPGTTIPVGSRPWGIAITPDGKTAYVTNYGGGSVTPIDLATNTPGTVIPVGSSPIGIAITPDGKTAYVANQDSGSVTAIDLATNTPGAEISVGAFPYWIAITPAATPQDVTPPSATPVQAPAANANGWNSGDVTVTWNWADDASGSGIDPGRCTTASTSSGEGTIDLSADCKDLAGNTGHAQHTVKVDKTQPALAPTVPTPVYLQASGVVVSPNATDSGGSGVDSSSCAAVNTSTAGDHTVTCNATDKAGNPRSLTIHYTVEYKILGFASPPPGSTWKAGQTVPVKFALGNANNDRISDSEAASLLSPACMVKVSASGPQPQAPTCVKYNKPTHQFTYNLALRKPTGLETITVTVTYSPPSTTTTSISETINITK